MHHLGIGTHHRRESVLVIADDTTITVVATRTGEIISANKIQPDKTYWRNTMKAPGRWPKAPQKHEKDATKSGAHDPTHV